jgi:Calcineurin-like phosphoesterase
MPTLIVSDLHLGSASRVDVLRRPQVRARLLRELADVDRLVLLGDVLELRHGPRRDALAAARVFFEELAVAFADREVVVLAGNHDHALVEPWLARRGELLTPPPPLTAEQRIDARDASPMMALLAEWAAPARLTVAYPGLWLRPDVYATHGHYLDCHLTIPTLERLGIGAMGRLLGRPAAGFTGPEDYEAVISPVCAWVDAVAGQAPTGDALNGRLTVRAWRAFGGDRDSGEALGAATWNGEPSGDGRGRHAGLRTSPRELARALRDRAIAGALPLALAALNRAGLGPLHADISTGELRRAGLRAMGEVTAHLNLDPVDPARPNHIVFGHTHRAGPLPGDRESEWLTPGGARLVNAGCWSYDAYFLTATPGESPYWPGGCVLVEEEGPPVLRRLLTSSAHAELMPVRA